MLATFWYSLGRRPGEVIPPHLDIVVGEFAKLVIIHAQEFSLLARAKVQAWDEVDSVGDEQRHAECPAAGSKDVGDLDVENFPLLTDPAAGDDAGIHPIKPDDVGRAEECVRQEAKNAGEAVLRQDIHTIIDTNPVLDYWTLERRVDGELQVRLTFSSVIAYDSGHNAKDDRPPRRDDSGCRCSSY